MFKNIPIYNYLIMPRSGIISITVGATHGKQNLISVSPEGAEYKDGFLPNKFNPFRVVRRISFKVRGLHPRLLKLDPFGVTASELFMLKSVKYKTHWQIGTLAHWHIGTFSKILHSFRHFNTQQLHTVFHNPGNYPGEHQSEIPDFRILFL